MRLPTLWAGWLALAAGCASPEFRPVESRVSTPVELAAASYDLQLGGEDLGDLKVWSEGAPEEPAPGAPAERQVSLRLRLRNDTEVGMQLDLAATSLEVYTADDRRLAVGEPLLARGEAEVGPGRTRSLELIYLLPRGVELTDVAGYELSWALAAGARRISRSTAFRRAEATDGRYYPWGTYPGYGGWGWHPGHGWYPWP